MADVTIEESVDTPKATAAPKVAQLAPKEWMKENLFSSKFNGGLTVLFGVLLFWAAWKMLEFTFSAERQWDAVATNLRLLLTTSYPESQYTRIWVSLGVVVVLTALTLAAWDVTSRIRIRLLAERGMMLGGVIMVAGLMAPFSVRATIWYLLIGGAVVAVGLFVRGWAAPDATVNGLVVVATGIGLPILSLWLIPYGHHALVNGELVVESGTVARTTSGPWTVMWVLGVAAYLLVSRFVPAETRAKLRGAVIGLWFMSPLIVVFLILRDPDFDYDHILSTEVPIFLGFALLGGAYLYWLAKPGVGEIGRVVAAITLVAGFVTFGFEMLQLVRLLTLALALFALAAPTFSGEAAARRRFSSVWIGTVLLMVWFITAANSPSTVQTLSDWFPGGFSITLIVATFTLILSFPMGVILALARTSRMPIFRMMSTFYIEVVRGVPFITVLVFFVIMVPLFLPSGMEISRIASVVLAFSLFSAAYLAENVRGGLQAIRRGQHEAAEALGMSGSQKTVFIVLPQALRVSIPPLVGQVIGTFKETSLLSIIGVFDLLFVARTLIPTQTFFLGSLKESLIVIAIIYWFFTYNMSKASQRIEQKLGVGER